MADAYIEQVRLGYKVPRSVLLPPYMSQNPYFMDLMNSIDTVFSTQVDAKIDILANIRNMWVSSPAVEQIIVNQELIPFSAWPQPERAILSKQTNLLGMNFQNAGVLSNDAYQQVSRNVGCYWFQKGTQAFIEFINYCLGTNLVVVSLWTEDYVTFVPEADAGTPIWEGGPWYPTTHVQIQSFGGFQGLDLVTLNSFFYEIANYNLVLYSIDAAFDMYVVDVIEPNHTTLDVVAIGLYGINSLVMSTEFRYGANAPPFQSISPAIPTQYSAIGAPVDFSDAYLLADPSSFISDESGNKYAVYSVADQAITVSDSLPTQLMGPASDTGNYTVLYGPVEWVGIPGSSRSAARIPDYSTGTPTVTSVDTISTRMIGHTRSNILVNPKGFAEISPGKFTPYW
jgi:hypothetical protein